MTGRFSLFLLAVSGVLALCLSGCSGSAGPAADATSNSTPTTPASTSAPSTTTSATPSGRPARPQVSAAVGRAYETFFGSKSNLAQSQAALQHGAAFHDALAQQGKSQYASSSGARVHNVRLISPDVAALKFDITSHGQPLLPGIDGYAVRQHGRWMVAAKTFCSLMTLQGGAPKACNDPAVTALPS